MPLSLRRRIPSGLVLCCFVASATTLIASQIRPVNLETMSERAGRIFSGRCTAVLHEFDPALGQDVTIVTFDVERAIKGEVGDTLTVKLIGQGSSGTVGSGIIGLPEFKVGEELVLFLYGESSAGLSAPVGLGQGKFTVFTDKQGHKIAVNEFGNKNLLRGLSVEARGRLDSSLPEWSEQIEPDPATLLDMAGSLAARPQPRKTVHE